MCIRCQMRMRARLRTGAFTSWFAHACVCIPAWLQFNNEPAGFEPLKDKHTQ